MCDRLSFNQSADVIEARFGASFDKGMVWRSEARPSESILTIVPTKAGLVAKIMRWGLSPDLKSVQKGSLYRVGWSDAFKKNVFSNYSCNPKYRCLIPVESFLEWEGKEAGTSTARLLRFQLKNEGSFALAGFWLPSKSERMSTCALITTPPNSLISPLRNSMPAILQCRADEEGWLDHESSGSFVSVLLKKLPVEKMAKPEVATQVILHKKEKPE